MEHRRGHKPPPGLSGHHVPPASDCPFEGCTHVTNPSAEVTPEGVKEANSACVKSSVREADSASPAPVARVLDEGVLVSNTEVLDGVDEGDLVSTRAPQVILRTTCAAPGTQPAVAPQGSPAQADPPQSSGAELGDTAVSRHPAVPGEVPTCSADGGQPPVDASPEPSTRSRSLCLKRYGSGAVFLVVGTGGAYLLFRLVAYMMPLPVTSTGLAATHEVSTLLIGAGVALLGGPTGSTNRQHVTYFMQYWARLIALSILLVIALSSWIRIHLGRVTRNSLRRFTAARGKQHTQVCVLWTEDPASQEVVRMWSLWLAIASFCYFPIQIEPSGSQPTAG
jgi:hypothetical protein